MKIEVNGANAHVAERTLLTSGAVGLTCEFAFDRAWDGLMKTAVFRAGSVTRDVVDMEASVTVPHEVLETAGQKLLVGVYGVNKAGDVVIPTVWADMGLILSGADPSGDPGTDPTLPVWAQVQVDTVQTVPQALTEKQQAQARENINAVSEEKLTALQEDVTGLEQAQIDLDGKLAELQQSQSETDSKLTEVQSDISSIKDTVTEMQEDVTENTSAIEALQSHTSYKKLYDTVTVTAEDIAAAGDEGVTVITVGDENIELSQYTEIIIKTYVPRNATTNSKSGYLAVNLGSTADFDSSLSLIYSYGVSGGGRAIMFYPSSTNYSSISTKWAGNDLLTGSITMVAGSVGAPYTSSGLGATQKDILRGAKYIHLFADIDSNTPWKFPAGSYVEVYAR